MNRAMRSGSVYMRASSAGAGSGCVESSGASGRVIAVENPHRPALEQVPPHQDIVSWCEPHPEDDLTAIRGITMCSQRVERWACGCGAEGRAYAGELPAKCPKCGNGWKP